MNSFNTGSISVEVRTDHFAKPSHWTAVGVAHASVSLTNDYGQSYSLSSQNQKYSSGLYTKSAASGDWTDGDSIRVTLDCDSHTLEVKNMRTGRGESWNLPNDGLPWHLYVNMFNPGDQVTLHHSSHLNSFQLKM